MTPAGLRAWRIAHNLDQRQAAAVLGMSHGNYNRIEAGRAGDLALLSALGRISALGNTPLPPPPRTGPGRGRPRSAEPPPIVARIRALREESPWMSHREIGVALGRSGAEIGRYCRRWGI